MRGITTFLAGLALATSANAAVLANIKGEVKVDKGNGFVAVSGSTSVTAGDRLRIARHSSATIYYDNGCSYLASKQQDIVIPKAPQCQRHWRRAIRSSPVIARTHNTLIVGGIVLAIGSAAAIELSKDSNPASP